jgi:hypothetical protein
MHALELEQLDVFLFLVDALGHAQHQLLHLGDLAGGAEGAEEDAGFFDLGQIERFSVADSSWLT